MSLTQLFFSAILQNKCNANFLAISMKRLWAAIERACKAHGVDERAVKLVEKIEKGERTIRAPHYKGEEQLIARSVENKATREELDRKRLNLDENLKDIHIRSSDVSHFASHSSNPRSLPTKESKSTNRRDIVWEFGFYEPPNEKIPKNMLTFREAIDLMKAKVEIKNEGSRIEEAKVILRSNPSVSRVDSDKIDRILQYFLPFETSARQRLARFDIPEHLKLRNMYDDMDKWERIDREHKDKKMRKLIEIQMKKEEEQRFNLEQDIEGNLGTIDSEQEKSITKGSDHF